MTVKEAILKVLEEQKCALTYLEVHKFIDEKSLIDWSNAKTPTDTTGAQLGDFIRKNDARVKRVKGKRGYEYYLSKYEEDLNLSEIVESLPIETKAKKSDTYQERDLHKLLSSYLKNKNTYSKTIFHERSANSKDRNQKWIHPDMVGVKFSNLKNKSSQALMKIVSNADIFELSSYELKREIKSDYDLKQSYFQAVSNSSWSNYGYLVAFEINDSLKEEIKRLNESFGIGVIELKANPYESEILFPAKYKSLDFKTIDKLCEVNGSDFEEFIKQTETLLIASDRYIKSTKKELEEFCDDYFNADSEIEKYCIEKNIPNEEASN